MNIAFAIAAFGSILICGIHIVAGGRENVRPLLQAKELPQGVAVTLYYSWHLVSITLAAMGVFFLLAALNETYVSLAVAASTLSALFAALSLFITAVKRLRFADLPQWVFFAPVAVCGFWGLMA